MGEYFGNPLALLGLAGFTDNPLVWVGFVALVVLVGVLIFLRTRKEDE